MAKKDFTQVYDVIANATAQEEQEVSNERKPRRGYTAQEAQEILSTMQTSGRKGIKLPRINLAFSPENYEYVVTMSRVRGENLTQFINKVIAEHREAHGEIYEKAIEFRNSL